LLERTPIITAKVQKPDNKRAIKADGVYQMFYV